MKRLLSEIFTEASKIPRIPGNFPKKPCVIGDKPTATKAPTIITDEIALVTDIKGVCNAGVTLQTT